MTRSRWSSGRVVEDRLAIFLRGLVIGAFVGAMIAGSTALRRTLHR
jgi:hypothetical protein